MLLLIKYYFYAYMHKYLSILSRNKAGKTELCTQLKQTKLENQLHISRGSPKEGFNDMFLKISWMH